MILSKPLKIGDCGSRVLWMGEDAYGNVAAVGSSTCIFARNDTSATMTRSEGQPIAIKNGWMLTLLATEFGSALCYRGEQVFALPITTDDILDTLYSEADETLFVLTSTGVFCANTLDGGTRTIDRWNEPDDCLERLSLFGNFLFAYRYGLRLYDFRKAEKLYESLDNPYSHVCHLGGSKIVAGDVNGNIDLIEVQSASSRPIARFSEAIRYVGCIQNNPVVVHQSGGTAFCEYFSSGSHRSIPIGQLNCDVFAAVRDTYLAVGSIQGDIVICNLENGDVEKVSLEPAARIVEMLWCEKRSQLFVGTRSGEIYALDEE